MPRATKANTPGRDPCVGVGVVTGTRMAVTGVVWPAATCAETSQSEYPGSLRRMR